MALTPTPDALGVDEPEGANFSPHPGYATLDDGLQAIITPKQYAWMPDAERQRFISSIGEPDTFVDA